MKYNEDNHYRVVFVTIILVLTPLFYLMGSPTNSLLLVFPATIIGVESSYIFPRQAMKLYEEILYKSLTERFQGVFQVALLVFLAVSVVYGFKENKLLPIFLLVFVYLLRYFFSVKQSIVIGSKNIIIGRRLFSHDSISYISFEKKGLVVEVESEGETFTIYNWALGKKRKGLEAFIKQINQRDKMQFRRSSLEKECPRGIQS